MKKQDLEKIKQALELIIEVKKNIELSNTNKSLEEYMPYLLINECEKRLEMIPRWV